MSRALWKKFYEIETENRWYSSGQSAKTTTNEDRCMQITTKMNRRMVVINLTPD